MTVQKGETLILVEFTPPCGEYNAWMELDAETLAEALAQQCQDGPAFVAQLAAAVGSGERVFIVSRITASLEGTRELEARRPEVDGLGQPIHWTPSILLVDDGSFADLRLGDRFVLTRTGGVPDGDRTEEEGEDHG